MLYRRKYPLTSRNHLPSTSGFRSSPSPENMLGGGIFGCIALGGGGGGDRGAGGSGGLSTISFELLLELLLELSLGGFGGLGSSGEGVLGCLVSRYFPFRSEECSNSASTSGKWCRMPCSSRRSANCIANCCSSSALIESASVLA